jgi:hypothetical protein
MHSAQDLMLGEIFVQGVLLVVIFKFVHFCKGREGAKPFALFFG